MLAHFPNLELNLKPQNVKRTNDMNYRNQSNQSNLIHSVFTDLRHRDEVQRVHNMISKDIEENPGPRPTPATGTGTASSRSTASINKKPSLLVNSYNVRGLNDEKKLRHLINYCYSFKGLNSADYVFCMQETYISQPLKIPFLWRGNYFLTPGEGHSCGCLTLLSNHLNVIESRNIEHRAHVLVCQRAGENKIAYIIANVYAPNPNTRVKTEFFERLFNVISELEVTYDCSNIIIAGDFNLNFSSSEIKNRNYSSQEQNVARVVAELIKQANLTDVWCDRSEFTWKRANSDSYSTIDRILFSRNLLTPIEVKTNWAVSVSDHAAVEARFEKVAQVTTERTKISRLDPSVLRSEESKARLTNAFQEMYSHVDSTWNPHLKLEYAKMCIRTVSEKEQADRKRKEKSEEDFLNVELDLAIKALGRDALSGRDRQELIEHVEELRSKKSELVDEKGARLAEKLGTKWYNEGEKSTRYFLRLLNRTNPDKFQNLEGQDGTPKNEPEEIEKEIVTFYRSLYENYDKTILQEESDDDFFSNIEPVPAEEADEVTRPIEIDELWKTLQSCNDSAPGPDGIPYSFLKHLWATMGPLLRDAWNYSILTGKLCPSHRVSLLRLIPKAGKDLSKLTNWRPITLSNCDHKLITKTYSNRLCEKLATRIGDNQTAYLKGRLINDNVRALLATIQSSNEDPDIDGLIVSLDAKKAFDSVEHSYIIKCLTKIGCGNFVPVFKTLYDELESDIIVNGRVVKGFKIKRGVKQGDALSCILFILCIEPLLRNIVGNNLIENISVRKLNKTLPKAYAYADDVSAVCKNSYEAVRAIFHEYSRMSKLSGLVLNADKTEILRVNKNDSAPLSFRINYLNENYEIKSQDRVKVNGILLQQNKEETVNDNVNAVAGKIEKHLRRWAPRHLSTLGKILILKTFGMSQIIFLLQTMTLGSEHVKLLNSIMYKFIWNRHFLAAKAPERVKREIVNTPINLGGYGMLDLTELDESLKLRSLGRLLRSQHPYLKILRDSINLEDYFFPSIRTKIDSMASKGVELLRSERLKMLGDEALRSDRRFLASAREVALSNIINKKGINSLAYFTLRRQGLTKVGMLTQAQLNQVRHFIDAKILPNLAQSLALPPGKCVDWGIGNILL